MRQRNSPFAAFGCWQFTSEFNFKYKRLPEFSLHMTQSAVKSHNGPADRLQSVGGACR